MSTAQCCIRSPRIISNYDTRFRPFKCKQTWNRQTVGEIAGRAVCVVKGFRNIWRHCSERKCLSICWGTAQQHKQQQQQRVAEFDNDLFMSVWAAVKVSKWVAIVCIYSVEFNDTLVRWSNSRHQVTEEILKQIRTGIKCDARNRPEVYARLISLQKETVARYFKKVLNLL